MLKNAPTLAIVAVHTEENEPSRVLIRNTTNIYIHYLEPRNGTFFGPICSTSFQGSFEVVANGAPFSTTNRAPHCGQFRVVTLGGWPDESTEGDYARSIEGDVHYEQH